MPWNSAIPCTPPFSTSCSSHRHGRFTTVYRTNLSQSQQRKGRLMRYFCRTNYCTVTPLSSLYFSLIVYKVRVRLPAFGALNSQHFHNDEHSQTSCHCHHLCVCTTSIITGFSPPYFYICSRSPPFFLSLANDNRVFFHPAVPISRKPPWDSFLTWTWYGGAVRWFR